MKVAGSEGLDASKLTLGELEDRLIGAPVGNNIANILTGIQSFHSGTISLEEFAKILAIAAVNLAGLAGWYNAKERVRDEQTI